MWALIQIQAMQGMVIEKQDIKIFEQKAYVGIQTYGKPSNNLK